MAAAIVVAPFAKCHEAHSAVVPQVLQARARQSVKTLTSSGLRSRLLKLVNSSGQSLSGRPVPPTSSTADSDYQHFPVGVGSPSGQLVCRGPLAGINPFKAHQLPRVTSNSFGHSRIPVRPLRESSPRLLRQHDHSLLPEQTGRNSVKVSLPLSFDAVGFLYHQRHHPDSDSPTWVRQHDCRCCEQWGSVHSRVGGGRCLSPTGVPMVGGAENRCFRHGAQQKVQPVLQQGWHGPTLPRGWTPTELGRSVPLHVSAAAPTTSGSSQT